MVVITYTPDQVSEEDLIHCNVCKTQIGFVKDHLDIVQNGRIGVFNSVFNVQILDSVNNVGHVNGNTVTDVYCVQCGMLLGLKLISVPRPSLEISEGRFLMNLEKLVYWNDNPMIFQEQDGSATNIDLVLNEPGGGGTIVPSQQAPMDELGGDTLVPSQQNVRASVGQAPVDELGGDALVPSRQNVRASVGQAPVDELGGDALVPSRQNVRASVGQAPVDELGGDSLVPSQQNVRASVGQAPVDELGGDALVPSQQNVRASVGQAPVDELGEDALVPSQQNVRVSVGQAPADELGGDALVPSQQNVRASVGQAPVDEDGGAVDQLADGSGKS